MIKMIVTDLDKTLLRSETYISEYTVGVLKNCRAKGIKVVFATARSTQAASTFIEQFNPDIFIGYGGAIAFAESEIIARFDIPADISNCLISECLQSSEVSYVYAINETVAYTNEIDSSDKSISHYQRVDFSQKKDISYLKISLNADNPEIVENIASHFPMCDMLRYTGENLYRFANRDAVKWNAVKAVAEHYNISTDTVAAFGDDINDLEMIKNCGVGIAMENAIDGVKAVADYICDTNDNDGVAKWIEKHILNGQF